MQANQLNYYTVCILLCACSKMRIYCEVYIYIHLCMYVCMYVYPHLHNAILCLCMYVHNACAIHSYVCICIIIHATWAMLAQHRGQNEQVDDSCRLSKRQAHTAIDDCKLLGRLATYTALTVAMEHYSKDKGAFITTSHSEYAHGCYVITCQASFQTS